MTDTALEEIVPIAEETNADVIHASHYFNFQDCTNNKVAFTFQRRDVVNAPTLETFDIAERIQKFISYGFVWWGCNKLFRKDFLIENNIKFPQINAWEDLIFVFQCVVCAKNYVRVPNIFYVYRIRNDSLSHVPKKTFDMIETTFKVVKELDNFMTKNEFFQKNPLYRYLVLDWHIQERLDVFCQWFYKDNAWSPFMVNIAFRQKFSSANFTDNLAFASYFFTAAIYQKFLLYQMNEERKHIKQKFQNLSEMLLRL